MCVATVAVGRRCIINDHEPTRLIALEDFVSDVLLDDFPAILGLASECLFLAEVHQDHIVLVCYWHVSVALVDYLSSLLVT